MHPLPPLMQFRCIWLLTEAALALIWVRKGWGGGGGRDLCLLLSHLLAVQGLAFPTQLTSHVPLLSFAGVVLLPALLLKRASLTPCI